MADKFRDALSDLVREQIETVLGPHLQTLSRMSAFLTSGSSGSLASALKAPAAARRRGRTPSGAACAIIGCKNPAKSKGYCVNHYQKFRKLQLTNRLPSDWSDPGRPQAVKDIILPRGRAASKALRKGKRG